MNYDEVIATARKQTLEGERDGRQWAENHATIRDLERIWDMMCVEAGGSMYVLSKALRMSEYEVQQFCFAGKAYSECYAEAFVGGAAEYLEECDDGTFFKE